MVGWIFVVLLFFGMLGMLDLGRRARKRERDGDGAVLGFGAVDGAAFGLMGLVLAFTFSGAAARAEGKRMSSLHMVGFAAILAMSVYVILDLEYPRIGLIRVNDFDRVIVDVRESMR